MKQLAKALLLVTAFTYSTAFACDADYVKYRDTPVCLDEFEYQDTSRSSFVRGAWYDSSNNYMLISLKGTKYHYCRVPDSVSNNYYILLNGNLDNALELPLYQT